MKRASVFLFVGFLGLVFLAASMFWMPRQVSQPAVSQPSASTAGTTPTAAAIPAASLQFPNWPKPAAVLVVTGEQQGYFEPCGCTASQLGGMTRRAGLFRKLRDLSWDVRGVDLGSVSSRTGVQAQLKFETTLQALRELGYVALGVGPEELRLDPGYLLSQHLTDGEDFLGFVSANLTFFGTRDLGTPLALRILDVGGVRIGITSVLSETLRNQVLPAGSPAGDAEWTSPEESLSSVMREFDAQQVQFRVLLSQATLEESRQIARTFPQFNLVVCAQGFGDGESEPELVGSVRLIQAGEKGKTAGVIGIYPASVEQPVRFELVTLNGDRFGDDPAMIELMQQYQQRLREQRLVSAEAPVRHPSGASFVGARKCGECHSKAFAVWEKSAHAHALESLDPAKARRGAERLHGIQRFHDPECLACHVTGWDSRDYVRFETGFLNQEFAADQAEQGLERLLAGNQCENCHGPGSRHVELIESGADASTAAQSVRVTLQQARDTACYRCHDGENSPEFDFDRYWQQVQHPGKD
ncbi:MAG: multiheme c-type cytochrome [Planctomycetota bacterium]